MIEWKKNTHQSQKDLSSSLALPLTRKSLLHCVQCCLSKFYSLFSPSSFYSHRDVRLCSDTTWMSHTFPKCMSFFQTCSSSRLLLVNTSPPAIPQAPSLVTLESSLTPHKILTFPWFSALAALHQSLCLDLLVPLLPNVLLFPFSFPNPSHPTDYWQRNLLQYICFHLTPEN